MKACSVPFLQQRLMAFWAAVAVFVVLVAGLPAAPADAQGPPVQPESCDTDRSTGLAVVTFVVAPSDNADRYILFRTEDGGVPIWSKRVAPDEVPTFNWVESEGVAYEYSVKARGIDGSFAELTHCDIGPPVQPESCDTDRSTGLAVVTFVVAPSDNADRYILFRTEDGGVPIWSKRVAPDEAPTFNWVESEGVAYEYSVKARGIDGSFAELTHCDQPLVADTFACLSDTTIDTTWAGQSIVGRTRPGHLGQGAGIDLRGTTITVHDASLDAVANGAPVVDSRWGLVGISSSTDLCVAGGQITSPNPYNATWAEIYDTEGLGLGSRLGTTRNHAAVNPGDSESPTVAGLYFFNLHDGPRFNESENWTVEHSWGGYTRDDCIENDRIASGTVYDSLFDGCFGGYSNRPGSSDVTSTGVGDTVRFDRVLLRMEMMPGPYKACVGSRTDLYFDSERDPYLARGADCVDREVYGTGNMFKLLDQADPTGSNNPMFEFIDSTFVVEQVTNGSGDYRADFPPADKVEACSNVTIVYMGSQPQYPGELPLLKFPSCFTILTGEAGQDHWTAVVTDWHARHPDVAPDQKDPSTYGDLAFPRLAFNAPLPG